jgi:hypothetical protein
VSDRQDLQRKIDRMHLRTDPAFQEGYRIGRVVSEQARGLRKQSRKLARARERIHALECELAEARKPAKPVRRWINAGGLNNGHCPYMIVPSGACCTLAEAHEGDHRSLPEYAHLAPPHPQGSDKP